MPKLEDTLSQQKATHEQLRRHNRQMLLRAIYLGLSKSRASLAQVTGLTKPTVSNLVAELIDEGLVSERGHGQASESGGKRPRLIEFQPAARQVIGVGVDHFTVTGVLTDLAGEVIAEHRVELDPERPLELLNGVIDGLRAQLDAPLLCIGVGLPGVVDGASGRVTRSSALGWSELEVAEPLTKRHRVPVHAAHGTQLSALAQFAFGELQTAAPRRLVTLLVERGVEVGVTLERGSVHYGADLGGLRLHGQPVGAGDLARVLGSKGELACEIRRLLGRADGEEVDYLELRYLANRGSAEALELIARTADLLAPLVAWAVALIRPEHLSIAGPITDLGEEFVTALRSAAALWLPPQELEEVRLSLASTRLTGALGAVALALQKELAII
ncbi:MAG TPA: ROK family transcriptional regulator [Trueperaceae bacterium]